MLNINQMSSLYLTNSNINHQMGESIYKFKFYWLNL